MPRGHVDLCLQDDCRAEGQCHDQGGNAGWQGKAFFSIFSSKNVFWLELGWNLRGFHSFSSRVVDGDAMLFAQLSQVRNATALGDHRPFTSTANTGGRQSKPTRGETNIKLNNLALTRPTRPPAKRVLRFWLTAKDSVKRQMCAAGLASLLSYLGLRKILSPANGVTQSHRRGNHKSNRECGVSAERLIGRGSLEPSGRTGNDSGNGHTSQKVSSIRIL